MVGRQHQYVLFFHSSSLRPRALSESECHQHCWLVSIPLHGSSFCCQNTFKKRKTKNLPNNFTRDFGWVTLMTTMLNYLKLNKISGSKIYVHFFLTIPHQLNVIFHAGFLKFVLIKIFNKHINIGMCKFLMVKYIVKPDKTLIFTNPF